MSWYSFFVPQMVVWCFVALLGGWMGIAIAIMCQNKLNQKGVKMVHYEDLHREGPLIPPRNSYNY